MNTSVEIENNGRSERDVDDLANDVGQFPEIDQAISDLNEHKDRWVTLDIPKKIKILEEVCLGVESCAEAQVRDAMNAKGIPLDSPLVSEDWLSGPYATQRIIKGLLVSLESLQKHGHTGVKKVQI